MESKKIYWKKLKENESGENISCRKLSKDEVKKIENTFLKQIIIIY